jgi:DNA-directed RNA polymerase subunit RPC12/RpoP
MSARHQVLAPVPRQACRDQYLCDRCHQALASRFAGHQLVCHRCRKQILLELLWEQRCSPNKREKRMEKKYTVPFTALQVRNTVLGRIFEDHGRMMRVTRIGTAYIDPAGKPVYDCWAVPELGGRLKPATAQ